MSWVQGAMTASSRWRRVTGCAMTNGSCLGAGNADNGDDVCDVRRGSTIDGVCDGGRVGWVYAGRCGWCVCRVNDDG